jgi:aspartyl-tRNA(Asn)/glutamyl-tRNA(Gln) amidotransferase subunit C
MGMAKLSTKEVKHVAKLARLTLSEKEVKRYSEQLSEVLDYMNVLDEVNIMSIEPTSQTTGLKNVYREDEIDVNNSLNAEEATSGSDEIYNNYFIVPALIKK